jgi:hypothetical protein
MAARHDGEPGPATVAWHGRHEHDPHDQASAASYSVHRNSCRCHGDALERCLAALAPGHSILRSYCTRWPKTAEIDGRRPLGEVGGSSKSPCKLKRIQGFGGPAAGDADPLTMEVLYQLS